jgi:flagellar protein FlaJ
VDPKEWILKRVLPAVSVSVLVSLVMMLLLPDVFMSGWPLMLLIFLVGFTAFSAVIFPVILRDRKRSRIEETLHLFIIRIGVVSLSSSTRTSIYELAARDKSESAISAELGKVRNLSRKWKMSIPESLRLVARTTPSKELGDFLERMAYAIETDEDPKMFFRNEQEAVLEEYKSRYSNTLDRIEVVREVYISMVTVTMFLNVMLVVLSLMISINNYLVSFLIVFIFIMVEIVLWILVDRTLPDESIWYRSAIPVGRSSFLDRFRLALGASVAVSLGIGIVILFIGMPLSAALMGLAITMTPLMVPGYLVIKEERTIMRRDQAFGAFIRILGATAESRGGIPLSAIKRLRWHDFGPLTEQIKNLYDRLETRIDQEGSWALFVKESRSDLISQFMNTYLEGVRSGGSPKEVSSLVSTYFTSLGALRRRRYLMADNFTAILYSLTLFISGGMFMIFRVVQEMLDRLGSLETLSSDVEGLAPLVLIKSAPNLELILLIAITMVVIVHVIFSADAVRKFRGSSGFILLMHVPGLMWTAAISGYLATYIVGMIL